MTLHDDTTLLAALVREGSEEAFGVLARRYTGLLYRAGLRQTGRLELAQEAGSFLAKFWQMVVKALSSLSRTLGIRGWCAGWRGASLAEAWMQALSMMW